MSRRSPSLAEALQKTQAASVPRLLSSADVTRNTPENDRPFLIDPAAIQVGKRLRAVDQAAVDQLIQSIQSNGNRLLSPIVVRPAYADGEKGREEAGRYLLVAGAHRLAAAKKLDWFALPAFVRDLSEEDALLTEIDENLARKELTPLERALCIQKRQEIYRQNPGSVLHGGDRKSIDYKQKNQVLNFSTCSSNQKIADDIGLSQASVRRAISIAKGLHPTIIDLIKNTPLANKEGDLYRLAGITDPKKQQAAAERLLTSSRPQPARKTEKTDDGYGRLMMAWEKASPEARQRFMKAVQ